MVRRADAAVGGPGAVKGVAALLLVVALSIVVLLLIRARPAPEPFDPRSGQPSGTRGLVLTLSAAGADVSDTRAVPSPEMAESTRVLVLDDRLDPDQRSDLLDFVEAGGVAVVADPDSSLHGGSGVDGGASVVTGENPPAVPRRDPSAEANVTRGDCDIAALADVRGIFVSDGVLFPVGGAEPSCFTRRSGSGEAPTVSFVIVRELGDGLVIGLGDNEPFTNRDLRFADNAALAAALLVPEEGAGVTIVVGRGATTSVQDVGSGDDTLVDLVPSWAWMSLVLAALSFVVYAIASSVRVGRIVSEPLPTPIAASDLVSATGNLMQRAGHASRAAWLLRDRYHRDLCDAFGVSPHAPLSELDRVVSERAGTAPGEIEHRLRSEAVDDAGLHRVAIAIHTSRSETMPDLDRTTADRTTADRARDHDRADERATTP